MRTIRFNASTALASAAFAVCAFYSTQAAAQTAPGSDQQGNCADGSVPTAATPCPPQNAGGAPQSGNEIVVTGSRIRRPNLDSPVPVTTISGEEFFKTGTTSVGDVLNELPALTSTFSQSNSTRFLGTSGLSLLDLRGLGTQRTLVLVNGRRHVAGDILNEAVSPDVNTIPTDLIERVDVVTGGDSAVYGSDAVAGVVNFVLKDHYDGVQVRAQSGISQYGDAPSSFASLLAGKNFAGGRGNIAVNLEYAHQGAFYADDRDRYRISSGFVTVDNVNNNGKPNRVFYHDIRSATYSNGGLFLGNNCGGYYCSYSFQPDGSLTQVTGQRVGIKPFGSFIGGSGDNFRDGTQLGLLPNQDRYSANLIGHFEISPAVVPFVEAKYVRTDVLGSASGPFFFNGGVTGSPREVFYTDNPYLSSQARTFLNNYYGAAPGDHQPFYFDENATSLTNRQERVRRDTYRIVAGVRGDLGSGWSYETSINYGQFDEKNEILGNVNLQRFLLAIDAVDEGQFKTGTANGHIVCRATVDPSARIALEGAANPTFAAAQLANDVAACQPANFFGVGNISDAARNYLLQNSVAKGRITQFVANAFLSGDTRNFFNLPGGPVGVAIGAEYRRETASYSQDDFTKAGLTFYNAIPDLNAPSFEVKEIFGELRLPILKDVPFFHELTLSGAARYASYKGNAGSVWAYNGNLEWSPVRDIRFRANYSRAVRAPTLVDLYTAFGQNYELITDPCSNYSANPGSTRATNCAAAGVPAGFNYIYKGSLGYLSGGNVDLKVETSDSYTVGTVITPRWVPGLSLTVDWFDINVNNAIATLDAQSVIDACYDQSSINNQFCGLFQRYNGAPGTTGPSGEIPGRILENSLHVVPLNYAKLRVRGIDVELGYQHRFGDIANVSTRLIYTHNFRNDTYLDASDPNFRTQQLGTLGFPFDEFSWNLDVNKGPFTLGYKLRYIGKMTVAPWSALHEVNGIPASQTDYSDIKYYPDTYLHNVRLQIDVNKKYNFYLGVDNVFNTPPPLGTTGAGFGSAIYDNVGRFFYTGITAKF
jgi:outer membrane receptor protein involved in Fe transport